MHFHLQFECPRIYILRRVYTIIFKKTLHRTKNMSLLLKLSRLPDKACELISAFSHWKYYPCHIICVFIIFGSAGRDSWIQWRVKLDNLNGHEIYLLQWHERTWYSDLLRDILAPGTPGYGAGLNVHACTQVIFILRLNREFQQIALSSRCAWKIGLRRMLITCLLLLERY